jgi:hypothetical protein
VKALWIYDQNLPKSRLMLEQVSKGIQNGLMWANATLRQDGRPMIYCQPDRLTITGEMVIEMVRKLVNDHPEWGKKDYDFVAFTALKRTFPCGH